MTHEPNLFIIGAPKCGTSALCQYLGSHPHIYLSIPKEPGFYSQDISTRPKYATENAYLKLFDGATDQHPIVGEASTEYLRSRIAVPAIFHRYPDAKFIAMFRRPIDFLQSWHSQMLRAMLEDVNDFQQAWNLTQTRRQGLEIPRLCQKPAFLDYHEAACFGKQVERLLSCIPSDRILFLKFDDFVADTAGAYDRVLAFLGLESDGRQEFPKVNTRSGIRSRGVADCLAQAMLAWRRLKPLEGTRLHRIVRRIGRRVGVWNRAPAVKYVMPQELREEITAMYADDIRRLQELTGLDLRDWPDLSPGSLENIDRREKTALLSDLAGRSQ